MRLSDEPERPMSINIVPMIDIIFSILAFFIISSLFLSRSAGLPVNLPKAATAEVQAKAQITVTLQADGAIAIDKKPVGLSNLEAGVRSLLKPEAQNIVVLKADERVSHGQVVAVMDQLRRVKTVTLAIAANRQEAKQ
jgi:biopolymer transport protein ExbD